jgi:hypothetical protein
MTMSLQYIEDDTRFMIYGSVTLAITLILLYNLVRLQDIHGQVYTGNPSCDVGYYNVRKSQRSDRRENFVEGLEAETQEIEPEVELSMPPARNAEIEEVPTFQFSDSQYEFGPLNKGIYGDRLVYMYDVKDLKNIRDWRGDDKSIYKLNYRSYIEDANRPLDELEQLNAKHGWGHR